MADFVGPKERLTVAQAAARKRKLAMAKREAEVAAQDARRKALVEAQNKAPKPKSQVTPPKTSGTPTLTHLGTANRAPKPSFVSKVIGNTGKVASKVGKFAKGNVPAAIALGMLDLAKKSTKEPLPRGMGISGNTGGKGSHVGGKPKTTPKGALSVKSNNTSPNKPKASQTPKAKETPKFTKYKVEHNDTLSGIAARAGVTLAELRTANPKITDPKKIFRNTSVNIPKGKTASGSYTGPVPYRPGSKAAAEYDAKRKKK